MEWKLFADLAEIAGGKEIAVAVEAENPTVGDALDALLAAHPDLEPRVYEDDGSLSTHVNVLVNGSDVDTLDGLDTDIDEADELALFPPVSGG